MKKSSKWEIVGHISVDAGVIKIGDPCYGECDWDKHLIEHDSAEIPHEGNLCDAGKKRGFGQAVVLASGLGDGVYAVEVKRADEHHGVIKEVRVRFF